jgi:hypothetical protein
MNNNPSGPNQPLNQHPLPLSGYQVLAVDAALITNCVVDTDYLVVPPPPEGAARLINPLCGIAIIAGATGPDAVFETVLRMAGGNEAILKTGTLSSPDDLELLYSFTASIILAPEDEGLFVRFTAINDGTVSISANWSDIRPITERTTVQLTQDGVKVDISPPADPGLVTKVYGPIDQLPGGWVLNTDDVPHDVRVSITDGVNDVDLGPAQTVAAGAGIPTAFPCVNVPEGWKVQARLVGSSQSVRPVYAVIPWLTANQGPARQDQGGAY